MSKRRMKCLISFILAIVLVMAEPLSAFGYIGAIVPQSEDMKNRIELGTFKLNNVQYTYIQNDYIHFDICLDKNAPKLLGTTCHTVPVPDMDKTFQNIDKAGRQKLEFYMTGMENYKPKDKFTKLTVASVSYKKNARDKVWFEKDANGNITDEDEFSGDLAVYYTFKEDTMLRVTNYFSLVKLNQGDSSIEAQNINKEGVPLNEGDTTENWGVYCQTVTSSLAEAVMDGGDGGSNGTVVRTDMKFEDFPRMGHPTITDSGMSDVAVNAQYITGTGSVACMNITSGVTQTPENSFLEVYSDSYNFAAPFVAASYYYDDQVHAGNHSGVEGHSRYASSLLYNNRVLTTKGRAEDGVCIQNVIEDQQLKIQQNLKSTTSSLWGFRGLTQQVDEETGQVTAPDAIRVRGDAPYLCVYPNGVDGNGKTRYQVLPADSKEDIDRLSKKYGDCVAQYQGGYHIDTKNGETIYSFCESSVALSPSITATWVNPTEPALKLKEDGTLVVDQKRIMLNAPTFKFYNPKDGGGLTFNGYDQKLGLLFGIDPDKNDSYINIDLPGNGVSVKGVSIDKKGNLVFTGKFKINLFAAQMDLKELGYGLNSSSDFVCNGIHASGKLKVPKIPGKKDDKDKDDKEEKDATPSVLGFGGASMQGEINTFEGSKKFDFTFELTIKSLFSTKAELTLVQLNNGRLCPNHIYFEIRSRAEGVGLDIPPGAPVVTLTGGGGGLDGLADTIDGNYVAIPPVVLTIKAYGEIVKIVDGEYTVKAGPSQLRFSGDNLAFKIDENNKLKIVDSLYAGIYLNGKELTYKGRTYQGVAFGGEMGLGIKIFNFQDSDTSATADALRYLNGTITGKVGLSAETYVGNALDDPSYCYVYIGNTGTASCSLNIPEGVPAIGGTPLLGAGLDYKIMAQTAFQTGQSNSAAAFFKNAKLSGGIAASGSIFPVSARVIYLFPANKVKVNSAFFGKLGDIDWDKELLANDNQNNENENVDGQHGEDSEDEITSMLMADPEVVELEDGTEAIVVAQANIMPMDLEELSAESEPDGRYTNTVQVANADKIADGENLVLTVVPKEAAQMSKEDMQTFASTISCNSIDTFNWVPEQITVSENDPGYNAWIGTYEADENHNVVRRAVFLAIPKARAQAATEGISISADRDFEIKGLATTPVTEVSAALSAADKLNVRVENYDPDKNYTLYTYLGKKKQNEAGEDQIGMDYLVDSRELSAEDMQNAAGSGIEIDLSGSDLAPTDDYYVSVALAEKMDLTDDESTGTASGNSDEETEIPVSTWQSDAEIYHYTNQMVPAKPASADLTLLGNEAMKGSWTGVEGADGYRVTIYREEGGQLVDTGRGFTLKNTDFTGYEEDGTQIPPMEGFSKDGNTYSIEMAMTVGESGGAKTVMVDGQEETISANAVEDAKALTPNQTYAIGVSAYKINETAVGDVQTGGDSENQTTEFERYSEERMSVSQYLPGYEQVGFDVLLGRYTYNDQHVLVPVDPYDTWETLTKTLPDNGGTGTYCGATNGQHVLQIQIDNIRTKAGADANASTQIEIVQKDENTGETVSANAINDRVFELPDFEGTLNLEIHAKHTTAYGTVDETIEYVTIDKDEASPMITLENEVNYSDENGNYVITGKTEPGATLKVNYVDPVEGDKEMTPVLAADGSFEISGTLVASYLGRFDKTVREEARVIALTAEDAVGNQGTAGTVVSRAEEITHNVTFEDGFGNVIATQVVKHGKDASVPVVPTHAGYIFDGWDREFKNIEANIRITALWKPGSTPAPKPSGGSGSGGQSTQKDVKVSSIKLTGVSTKIAAGKKIKLTAEVKPDNATSKKLKWSSSNTKVATVDQNGTVKVSKNAGGKKVTITAEAADGSGKKATYKITVMKKAVTSLSLSGKKNVKAGSKVKLKAKVKAPKGANKKLKWTCDKPEYATVNSKGVVKTKKSGKGKTVKITVMTTDGSNKKKTIKIKLK